jgi:biopolymer transport protein ExbD
MGRAKIPRKSTNIDMTAMCDVAFLLLSFFILATKQKPPEAVAVVAPQSVSSKAAPEKSILITLNKEGKVFLMLGDDTKKVGIIKDINTTRQLGLTDQEIMKLSKMPFIAMPLAKLKPLVNLSDPLPATQMEGIPIKDTANNELIDWLRSVKAVYASGSTSAAELSNMLLIKGDGDALYPDFQNVKYAFKQTDLLKFRLVTNSKNAPVGSELYNDRKSGIKAED